MSAALVRRVIRWYGTAARPLPWRAPGTTPWGVLVSEFMAQQTQVERVIPKWEAWLERWPAPSDLAAAPVADALRAWDRLGYPRRAKWLHEAAGEIATVHGDRVPSDTEALRALTGVGEYTAAAVQAFAYGMPSIVLDTNVRRVITRSVEGQAMPRPNLGAGERERAAALVATAERDGGNGAHWSQAVMELGALVCTARNPGCDGCPIATQCAWHKAGHPPAEWAPRRQAAFHGSDRQARGRIMALLRDAHRSVSASAIEDVLDDDAQRERALASLIADGLVVIDAVGDLRLP